jgi:hypothetical protein
MRGLGAQKTCPHREPVFADAPHNSASDITSGANAGDDASGANGSSVLRSPVPSADQTISSALSKPAQDAARIF